MTNVLISDPTLRDGNHAVQHQLNAKQIASYASAAENANIPIVEVGHGNGLGADSLQVGRSLLSDREMLEAAREVLINSKLGVHTMPGFTTINKDIRQAIEIGVDVFRVGSHCTEADVTKRHIEYLRDNDCEVYGVLMMVHMASSDVLVEEAQKMESYGAEGVVLMDSAGAFLPSDVIKNVGILVENLSVPIGFHAHNNLGMSIANAVAAVQSGAKIIDGTARGFGAGAGNAPLEVMIAVFDKIGFSTGINLYKILEASDIAERELMSIVPYINTISIVSGLAGVFSGFAKHVERISRQYEIDSRDVFFELGRRKVVAGQEDLIMEIAMKLAAVR